MPLKTNEAGRAYTPILPAEPQAGLSALIFEKMSNHTASKQAPSLGFLVKPHARNVQ